MRIGCLQFAPQVGDVPGNITRAEAVFSRADPQDLENLDLLVLPEMALSGYNFKSLEHITPYLEPSGSGASSLWARSSARKYGCTVAVGYPEKVEASGAEPECYNSVVVVNSDGEKLANYRKSFLYYTDATWAHEGQGFYGGKLGNFGQVAMGICMDINPYKFEAPWDAYEFGFHILRARANLVIMSMAWLTNDERTVFTSRPDAPDFSTLTYWVRRLEPVIQAGSPEETIVVFANRCGTEDEATYAGTSTVLGIKDGEVSVYGILGRGVEELLVVDTDKPPFAKLIDPSEAAVDGEPGAPPAEPADHSEEEEPSKDSNSGTGSGPADSPTLPSTTTTTAAGSFTTRTAQHSNPSWIRTSRGQTTRPQPSTSTKDAATQPQRPKLSILTDAATVGAYLPISPTKPGTTTTTSLSLLPASPPAEHSSSQAYARGLRDRLPSAIPIFVDVYTPDEPVWPSDEHEHQHEHYRHGLGATEEVRFGADALLTPSPTASSPLGRLSRGRTRITVAASPSVWGRAVAF